MDEAILISSQNTIIFIIVLELWEEKGDILNDDRGEDRIRRKKIKGLNNKCDV